ncbi:MAG TPA: 16S rRNA pseudouridine(516) synthase [Thiobacillaceae bacterium]|nr:16S rRNA pseudouridine(516) synthase [Thiobacillaceae bacterium]
MKLFRILQSQGFGSRKGCAAMVRGGAVAVNGILYDDPESDIDPTGLELTVDGVTWPYREKAYLLMHKPAGYECSHRPSHHPSVFTLLPPLLVARGVQCVGRLDQDTTGMLLFSDDGQFVHRMTSPKRGVTKVYRAVCAEPVADAMLATLRAGVQLNDEPAPVAALACERLDERTLRMTLAEGKYHQVRRMVAAAGNRVEALHRSMIGAYELPVDLSPGDWRWLEPGDLARLERPWPSAKS